MSALSACACNTQQARGAVGVDGTGGSAALNDLGRPGQRSPRPGLRWRAASGRPCAAWRPRRRGAARCGDGIWSGARPTSSAAPAMRLPSRAAASAASSIRLPRDRLIRKASGRISRSCAAPIRFSVSSVATASGRTKSERLQQLVELDLLDPVVLDGDVRVVHQHRHAEGQRQLGDAPAEWAVADDAGCGAGELASRAGLRRSGRSCRPRRRARCRARHRSSGRSPARSPPAPSCGSPA